MSALSRLEDKRCARGKRFSVELIGLSLLTATLAGYSSQRGMATYLSAVWCELKEAFKCFDWMTSSESAPSQSTLSRFLDAVDLYHLRESYFSIRRRRLWDNKPERPHYAIGGKARKGCVSAETGRTELDLSLFYVGGKECLGIFNLKDKQGEATGAANYLKMFGRSLPPGVITFDAGITGPSVCKRVVTAGHQYIAAVKGNSGEVYNVLTAANWEASGYVSQLSSKGHGRSELQRIQILNVSYFRDSAVKRYKGVKRYARVTSIVTRKGVATTEHRYYAISDLSGARAQDILKIIRDHWSIENHLHWTKDTVFLEDNMPKQGNRSSRHRGFLNSVAVSIGYAVSICISEFVIRFRHSSFLFLDKFFSL